MIAVGGQTGGGVDVVEATINGEIAAFGINGMFMKTMLNSFRASSIAPPSRPSQSSHHVPGG